ncbi:MAG: prolyl oligopeptidase family serine peptidase [Pseudomonadota bacterium]
MAFRALLLVVALLGSGTPLHAEAPPADAYAHLPEFTDLEIAPGGRYLAARVNVRNVYRLVVLDLSTQPMSVAYGMSEDDKYHAAWFEWASEDRLLISIGFVGNRGFGGQTETQERRLFSVKMGDGDLVPLFRPKRDEVPLQFQDDIVSFLHDDPDHILVQYSRTDPSEPLVYQVNVAGMQRHRRIERPRRTVRDWSADHKGNVRIGRGLTSNRQRTLFFKPDGEKKWRDFSHRVENADAVFRPVGFSEEPNVAYVISNHEVDPAGLYRFDIEADAFGELIFNHDSVDIAGVNIDPQTQGIRSINFVDKDVETVWFSDRQTEGLEGVQELFPDKSLTIHSISTDGRYYVLHVSGPQEPGQYLTFDSESRKAQLLPAQYPGVGAENIGQTIATEYEARDGLVIPAFVTLPVGVDSLEAAENLPFVIHPHGGPTARDLLQFSFDVQFWASRGYGVLQMNFRGSSGYGKAFELAGNRAWGQAMQDDITDGVNWLIESGIADPDRIAIAGGSYGGYAALMGVVKEPELFQCAISFAGVSDLPKLIQRERRFIDGEYRTRFIGRLWGDRKMLAENSPAKRADEIRVPVLLLHGDRDTVVDIGQSELMAKRLKKNDVPHEYIVFEDGDHHLSMYPHRLEYLQATGQFLKDCIGTNTVANTAID